MLEDPYVEAHPEDDDDEDHEEDPVDYLVDGGDDGDDEEGSLEDDDMDIEADEEEHPAPADSIVVAPTATDQASSAEETEPFETDEFAATPYILLLAMSSPPASPLSPWSSPPPRIPFPPPPLILSPPLPVLSPAPPPSPIRSLGYRATMIRLRDEAASTSSPPLQLPSASRREDRPEVTLPPQKRLGIAFGPRYEVGESSSAAAARPAGGLRADYGFVATVDREIIRDPEREIGYEITDSWDEIVETLQGAPVSTDTKLGRYMREFETRVRQDTDEIYMRLDDEQTERQLLAGRLNILFKDRHASDLVHGEVMSLRTTVLGQMTEIRELHAADRRRQTVISELLRTDHRRSTEITKLRTTLQGQKQMAPKRTTRSTADQETINATSVTNAQLQAMIDQGVTAALAACDALRSTNGDDSHISRTGVRRTERATRECTYTDFLKCQPLPFKGTEGVASLSQWCKRMESVFHISNCAVENQVKFATCTLYSVALTWKLEMELWDLKVKGTDLASYTQRYQELALLCERMFFEESNKIEKYIGGLPDMIHGSVVASKPKMIQEAIEIATELMDKKIRTFAEREIASKRKFKNTSRNTQNQQQQSNKRQNTGRENIDEQEILFNKMSRRLVEMNNNVLRIQEKILEKETKILELEGCVSNKDVEIEKCLERLNNCFENPSYFKKAKDLRPSLYDEKVIGLGYTSKFLTHSDEALEIEKFKRAREKKIEFAYDYGNLNANLDTFSSVRRPKHSGVIWKKKWLSNTSNVDLSSVSHSQLNKDVKRYSRKDLMSCNNSHLGETSSAYVCNDAMNVSCNSRLYDSFDENNLFIFNDVSVRNSPVSKMHFKKKPSDSLNVRSKSNSNKSLPRIMHGWLPKMQPLAEPVAKWILRVERNRALLTNFGEKFLGMVCFGNNDFAMIAGYGDVVIGSMTIKKVYYVKATATACFTQNRSIIHKCFDKTPYELMNKRKPNIKFFRVFGCSCYLLNDYDDVGKLKAKRDIRVFVGYSKESAAFRIYNKQTRKIHESVNIMKSSSTNVETSNVEIPSNEEEVFHENSKSFQEESSSSSLKDDVHQSLEEVVVPSSNTQTFSNNMVHNVDEASTSHNVFNESLEDAYFNASTSSHDPSNVHTFYQPYPYEKKWIKDHPLHKIIAEALRDADWVSEMQDELDQFARLKVWRLVHRPEGKTIIKTKWIFENKKDERSLVIRNKARLVAIGYSQ
nr:retrovirus-related Pol polyprotein from transposon TNT 1-94 [Tanacetum cinerariifolium]